jgi:hypothetical protein
MEAILYFSSKYFYFQNFTILGYTLYLNVMLSNTIVLFTGLSFALKRIGPLAAIIIIIFYLLVLYLLAFLNTPENPFASIYSEFLIKTACQHLLLLIGFDTLIYRKYYDTPLILVVH